MKKSTILLLMICFLFPISLHAFSWSFVSNLWHDSTTGANYYNGTPPGVNTFTPSPTPVNTATPIPIASYVTYVNATPTVSVNQLYAAKVSATNSNAATFLLNSTPVISAGGVTLPGLTLPSGVAAGNYGGASAVVSMVVNSSGQITSATNYSIPSLAVTGPAKGSNMFRNASFGLDQRYAHTGQNYVNPVTQYV